MLIGDNTSNSLEVIGIVSDVRESGLAIASGPEIYLPQQSYPLQTGALIVRTRSDGKDLAAAVRRQLYAIDPEQAIAPPRTMDQLLDGSIGRQKASLLLLSLFSSFALVLASTGIYGVLTYSVLQRFEEVGIRRALGAQAIDILRLILAQGLSATLAGTVLGLFGALALTRVLASLLFEVRPDDPLSFLATIGLFIPVALIASALPAWRAIRIDPARALR